MRVNDAPYVVKAVQHNAQASDEFKALLGTNSDASNLINLKQKSRAWNDSKVSAHHAIIPTQKKLSATKTSSILSSVEEKIYRLICRNYIAQFLPQHEEVIEKQTSPPKPFNDATLLAAMTGISAHVSDGELKKILKETDGLGTEATRAGIIELLFKRGYLRRQGKTIYSTQTGQSLIKALPKIATYPDLTARWESQLSAIHDGRSSYQQLMSPLEAQLQTMVDESRNVIPQGLKGLGGKPTYRKRKSATKDKKKSYTRKSKTNTGFKKSASR